jgi:hypothetical protein
MQVVVVVRYMRLLVVRVVQVVRVVVVLPEPMEVLMVRQGLQTQVAAVVHQAYLGLVLRVGLEL